MGIPATTTYLGQGVLRQLYRCKSIPPIRNIIMWSSTWCQLWEKQKSYLQHYLKCFLINGENIEQNLLRQTTQHSWQWLKTAVMLWVLNNHWIYQDQLKKRVKEMTFSAKRSKGWKSGEGEVLASLGPLCFLLIPALLSPQNNLFCVIYTAAMWVIGWSSWLADVMLDFQFCPHI